MIIGLDATPLTIGTGGVARYTAELARALAHSYPEDQYWLLTDQPAPALDPYLRNLHSGTGPRHAVEKKWWLWGLNQAMIRYQIQVFHGTDFSVPYLKSRPAVMTLHDLSPWMNPEWQPDASRVRARTPLLLRFGLAHYVITPSQAVRRAAIERFRLDANRVVAIPLAASPLFRPLEQEPDEPPYFLFVGTLEPRKNVHRMIEAWREVYRATGIELMLAGRTRADFEAPAPEPGLRLLGAVPDEDLPKLYNGALACIYPSLYEGFGLPVLEAMQCGALVVTTRDPAILEITEGTAAVHCDAEDTAALRETLHAIAQDRSPFREIQERAISRARAFSWLRTARETRMVYEAACKL